MRLSGVLTIPSLISPARAGFAALAAMAWLVAGVPAVAKAAAARATAKVQQFAPDAVNGAELAAPIKSNRPSPVLLKAQVLLDGASFSPGLMDAKPGTNFTKALAAFQRFADLPATGRLDGATWARLVETSHEPALTEYQITDDDVKGPFERSIPHGLERMAHLKHLGYRSPVELLSEKFHVDEGLLRTLNPGKPLDRAGTVITVPNVTAARNDGAVTRIEVDKAEKAIRAFNNDGDLVAFYPASIGSTDKPAPSGSFQVRRVTMNPTYHYDPKFKFKGVHTRHKLTVAPGPNNPVGLVWIDLSKPSYGIHGTPEPGQIGKTQSHGCIRLTNWDALDLARRVRRGVDVAFLD